MDLSVFNDIGNTLFKLKMYPYFDIANYALMTLAVREDTPQSGSISFSRRHPFACWLATMLMCFAGSILANFLIGEPLINAFKNHDDIFLATLIWYLINYSPFDIVYRLIRLTPLKLTICLLKEVQRAKKIHHGISVAYKLYPKAYLVCILIGVIKGSGYTEIKIVERLIRGVWLPASNEFLKPSFTSKACVGVSVMFLLEKLNMIYAPENQVYFGAVLFLIYFRLSSLLLGIHDPFAPFENLFCAIFMGGLVDALKRAVEGTGTGATGSGASPTSGNGSVQTGQSTSTDGSQSGNNTNLTTQGGVSADGTGSQSGVSNGSLNTSNSTLPTDKKNI